MTALPSCQCYATGRIRYSDRVIRHRQMDRYIQINPSVSFDEWSQYRCITVIAQNQAL